MTEELQWVDAKVPDKLGFYFEWGTWRVKGSRGGRGPGKSRTISAALAIRGSEVPIRWLCARETQKSLKFSSKQLIVDAINRHGLQGEYNILEDEIRGKRELWVTDDATGGRVKRRTLFTFAGIRELNVDAIKSLEDFDGVWIAEANNLSEASWNKIVPTFRKAGSEIWFDYNPEFEEDFIHRWWDLNKHRPDVKLVHVNYYDNPWFPDVLRNDMENDKATNQENYEHVWLGKARNSVVGAVYGKEMAAAYSDGRIVLDPGIGIDRSKPVDWFWDLGHGDAMAIWAAQAISGWFNVVDFYQNEGEAIEHYADVITKRKYPSGILWLPWDGVDAQLHHRLTGSNKRSPEQVLRDMDFKVRLAAKTAVSVGISSVRTIFPLLRFSEPKCHEGIKHLRRYQWGDPKEDGKVIEKPLHDGHSHAADALRTLATTIKEPRAPEIETDKRQAQQIPVGPQGWMATL